jgi:hypothetical protein
MNERFTVCSWFGAGNENVFGELIAVLVKSLATPKHPQVCNPTEQRKKLKVTMTARKKPPAIWLITPRQKTQKQKKVAKKKSSNKNN